MADVTGYWHARPYSDDTPRFASDTHYHRPNLGLWRLWPLDPVRIANDTARWLTLTGVAAAATAVLVSIRTWRAITHHHDEPGD